MDDLDKLFAGLLGLAIVAVVVSSGSSTTTALQSAISVLVGWIQTLMSPLSSATSTGSVSISTPSTATYGAPVPGAMVMGPGGTLVPATNSSITLAPFAVTSGGGIGMM